jgi:thioredoxin
MTPNAQLVDVRTAAEFAEGHLANAKNLDVRQPDFNQAVAQLDRKRPIFVYCLSGGRSKTAAEQLRAMGYGPVYEMGGGYLKWTSRLMPVEGVARSDKRSQWTLQRLDSLVKAQPLVLVDVYAPWCPPCKKMAPTIDKLATEWAGKAVILKVDADAEKSLLQSLTVDELPTILLYRNGKLVGRHIGFQEEKALRAMLSE